MDFKAGNPQNSGKDFPKKIIIGVDVGGTKIQSGAITTDGRCIGTPFRISTEGNSARESIIDRILESINRAIRESGLANNEVYAIGMGVTGPIDIMNGIVLECPQLPSLHFYPLKQRIQTEFEIPVFMNNDANALVLGEALWGAGKDHSSVLGFTLGTGLGCAIIKEGKIESGTNGMAGEIWISPYKDGTIEDYVSGRGISRIYQELEGKSKSALDIENLARQGDQYALSTWVEFGKAFGFALAWSINVIDPDIVIIGGSIANAFDLFEASMNGFLRMNICPVPAQKTMVVKAGLGDNAGYIGSAALALQEIQR
jgi:glucokinase